MDFNSNLPMNELSVIGPVFHSFLASLIGFIHGSVQYVTLWHVPVNVLPRLFL